MNASPVMNLQTNFGGGKTHSMLALWHMLSGRELAEYPQEVQDLLAGHASASLGQRVGRVALVGNHIAAGKGRSRPTARTSRRSGGSWPGSSAARAAGLAPGGIRDRRRRGRHPHQPGRGAARADRASTRRA